MSKQPFRIPIGIEDFSEMRSKKKKFLYCDKSLFARDVLEDGAEVMLFTRPRRFGKTLNMSLLHHFLGGEDPSLFEGLKITEDREFFEEHQGKYASIFFTMKELEATTLEEMLLSLSSLIQEVFKPYETFLDIQVMRFTSILVLFLRDLPYNVLSIISLKLLQES